MLNYQPILTTAGGRITCPRCIAKSSRTQSQCRRPALKSSGKNQKCSSHGGKSTGPKTAEGKARIAAAHFIHGEATKQARAGYSRSSAYLSHLEDALRVVGALEGRRIQGRKPKGYEPVRTLDGVLAMITLDMELNKAGAPPGRGSAI